MPAGTNRSVSYIAVIAVTVPILIGAWFAAPAFLPMYWWTTVDLDKISTASGIPKSKLETVFSMELRYEPRGEGDPMPWQIISMNPTWTSVHPDSESEEELLVRCTFLSQNDGKPPSTTFINNTYKDRYFKAKAYRLPPGSLGQNGKRPVVLYERLALDKMSIPDADRARSIVAGWENDDTWPDRDDGWVAPDKAQ